MEKRDGTVTWKSAIEEQDKRAIFIVGGAIFIVGARFDSARFVGVGFSALGSDVKFGGPERVIFEARVQDVVYSAQRKKKTEVYRGKVAGGSIRQHRCRVGGET
ncbi:MAG: hypothetical protein ACUVQK_07780 [Thermogutta sp.]